MSDRIPKLMTYPAAEVSVVEPTVHHPWSAMWWGEPTAPVAAFLDAARAVAAESGWSGVSTG